MQILGTAFFALRMLAPPQQPAAIGTEPALAFAGRLTERGTALLTCRLGIGSYGVSPAPAFDRVDRDAGFCGNSPVSFPALLQAGNAFYLLIGHALHLHSERVPLTSQWRRRIRFDEKGQKKNGPSRNLPDEPFVLPVYAAKRGDRQRSGLAVNLQTLCLLKLLDLLLGLGIVVPVSNRKPVKTCRLQQLL